MQLVPGRSQRLGGRTGALTHSDTRGKELTAMLKAQVGDERRAQVTSGGSGMALGRSGI